MITLVGTGHVFDIAERIRQIIEARAPQAVCVELDAGRYYGLTHPDEAEKQKEKASFFYRILADIQNQIAEQYGSQVGGEMIAAIDSARERRIDLVLIDNDARVTVQRMWKMMPFREKMRLFFSMFGGIFAKKTTVEDELEKFQENPEEFFAMIEKQMPTIKRILIDERNEHMAARVREAAAKYQNAVVVVGDGHVPGMSKILSDMSPETIRLKQLRSDAFSIKPLENSNNSVTFSYSFR
jgi:pheromone shutdown-related protein TraB